MRGMRIYIKKDLTSCCHHQIGTLVLQLVILREHDRMHDPTTEVPNTIDHCLVFAFLGECQSPHRQAPDQQYGQSVRCTSHQNLCLSPPISTPEYAQSRWRYRSTCYQVGPEENVPPRVTRFAQILVVYRSQWLYLQLLDLTHSSNRIEHFCDTEDPIWRG